MSLKRILPLGILLSALMFTSACVSSMVAPLKADINNLRFEHNETKKELSDLKLAVNSVNKDVQAINKNFADLRKYNEKIIKEESLVALKESLANLYSQISDISKDVQVLRGRFDENKYAIDKSLKTNSQETTVLQAKLNSIEQSMKELSDKLSNIESMEARRKSPSAPYNAQQDAQQPAQPDKKTEINEPPAVEKTLPADAQKQYDEAYKLYTEKKYDASKEKFALFLKDFPQHKLAGNVFFWTAEIHFAQKNFEDAILTYEDILKSHPNNQKVPQAMLKQALAFVEINDNKAGIVILKDLIKKHPKTEQAKNAEKKLKELEDKQSAAKSKPAQKAKPKSKNGR